ncbi:MAG: hypothetical protein ABI744_06770 [Chloroflexota bacterium]
MVQIARPGAPFALALFVILGCGGAGAPATTTPEPTATQDPSSVQPTTPEITAPASAGPTDSALDSGIAWPTTVETTLSSGIYVDEFAQGSFSSSAPARLCGPSFIFPSGFLFEFPRDPGGDVEDVTFGAEQLLPGTSTSSFSINVSIAASAAGGGHPLTSLDPSSRATDSGSASLSVAVDGTRTLVVDAAGEGGVTIHLSAVCSPA